jgi:hypothetical protein
MSTHTRTDMRALAREALAARLHLFEPGTCKLPKKQGVTLGRLALFDTNLLSAMMHGNVR